MTGNSLLFRTGQIKVAPITAAISSAFGTDLLVTIFAFAQTNRQENFSSSLGRVKHFTALIQILCKYDFYLIKLQQHNFQMSYKTTETV